MPENTEVARCTQRQDQIVAASRQILEAASGRELDDSEKGELAKLRSEFDALNDVVRAHAAVDQMATDPTTGRKTVPAPLNQRHPPADGPHSETVPVRDRTWRGMWGSRLDVSADAWRPGEFFATLAAGTSDHRFRAAASEQSGEGGGYLTPSYLTTDIMDRSLQQEIVRPLCRTYAMQGSDLSIVSLDTKDRSDGTTLGGLAGEWLAELAEASLQTPSFAPANLHARKLVVYVQASEELIGDAPNFDAELRNAFVQTLTYNLDKALLFGDGVAKPSGVFMGPGTISVEKEVDQTADTVNFANVSKMWSRLSPGSHKRAIWVAAPSVLPQLMQLRIVTWAGTSPDYITDASEPLAFTSNADGTYALFGRPLRVSEHCSALGDQHDIGLFDPDAYACGMRMSLAIQAAQQPGWRDFSTHFRGWLRVDGLPLVGAAIKLPNSAPTVSPYVTLDSR